MLILLVVILFIAGCSAPASEAPGTPSTVTQQLPKPDVIEWRIQTMFAAGVDDQKFFSEYSQGFCQLVKEMSGGRLIIKPFASGEIVPVTDCLEAVGKGVLEGGLNASAYWSGKIPVAAFAWGLPFSIYGEQSINTYLWDYEGGIVPILREAYKPFNVHFLGVGYASDSPLLSKKPVYTFDDYKGLKVRCIGMAADVLTNVGASITYLPAPEIYTGLETGVIDAANWGGFNSAVNLGLHEVTDYVLFPAITGMVSDEIIINKDAWNALPDDLKKIVEQAAYSHFMSHGRWNDLRNEQFLKRAVEEGQIEICKLPLEEEEKIRKEAIDYIREYSKNDTYTAEAFKKLESYLKLTGIIQ